MPSSCVQHVENLRLAVGKICVRVSPISTARIDDIRSRRGQLHYLHYFSTTISPISSTLFLLISPLSKGQLYPFSTVPIISITN